MKKKNIATAVAGLVLMGTSVAGLTGWYVEHQHAIDLQAQVDELQIQEKRSAIVRSVSSQMEEIAYQQKEISDEQREEALQQKRMADEMRLRSEVERQNALTSQSKAVVSEQQAQEARVVAESERQMAEHQRVQAEFSKRVADTLSYVALGRSLGSLSLTQAQLGNTELAALLAYSSYHFISQYNGDVYYPAIFQALMSASQSKRSWARHNGSLVGLSYLSTGDDRMVTISTFGEIMIHRKINDELQSETLLSDKNYDFRDVWVKNEEIYAISRSGHLVIINHGVSKVVPLPYLEFPARISGLNDDNLLIVGHQGIAQYNIPEGEVVGSREFDFKLVTSSRYDNSPLLFDNQGRQHLVKSINDIQTSDVPVKGRVTAFASSKNTKQRAYGMSDGTIYLLDEKSGKITKLEGHLSRISKLKLNGNRLYSSSYDGTLKLWNINSDKIEPMTLISSGSWIMDFNFDASKEYIWIGDQNGNLTEAPLSVSKMIEEIRKNMKRDFAIDEWNYYIGKNVPYESFVSPDRKEVKP